MKISVRKFLVLFIWLPLALAICASSSEKEEKTIMGMVKLERENQMALLDWFAGMFLSGLSAGKNLYIPYERNARESYIYADAMMEERKKYVEKYGVKNSKEK